MLEHAIKLHTCKTIYLNLSLFTCIFYVLLPCTVYIKLSNVIPFFKYHFSTVTVRKLANYIVNWCTLIYFNHIVFLIYWFPYPWMTFLIVMHYTVYLAGTLASNENHTSWLLIFLKYRRHAAVYVVDQLMLVTVTVLTLTETTMYRLMHSFIFYLVIEQKEGSILIQRKWFFVYLHGWFLNDKFSGLLKSINSLFTNYFIFTISCTMRRTLH